MSHPRRNRMEDLREEVRALRETATLAVQQHAARLAPDVPSADINAICAALGEITLEEAIAQVDQLQREARPL
jgi:polyhydroxyalkanoate synthesis regulator phasin